MLYCNRIAMTYIMGRREMVRTQIQLTEYQAVRLKEISERDNLSMAELIRRAVDRFFCDDPLPTQRERMERASEVFGKYTSADGENIAENHDLYLTEIYGQWKSL